jgi:hypothetical protein
MQRHIDNHRRLFDNHRRLFDNHRRLFVMVPNLAGHRDDPHR